VCIDNTGDTIMSTRFEPSRLLRLALKGDALVSGAAGLLLIAAAGPLAGLLGLPQPLLLWAGLLFLPWAAFVGWLGTRPALTPVTVWAVVVLNTVYVVACVAVLLAGWLSPTGPGIAFVLAQAVVVLVLAEAQYLGLRQSTRPGRLAVA
jgi:hypothetical protein